MTDIASTRSLIERFDQWSQKPNTGSLNHQRRTAEFAQELRDALAYTIEHPLLATFDPTASVEFESDDSEEDREDWEFPGVVKTWPIVGDE